MTSGSTGPGTDLRSSILTLPPESFDSTFGKGEHLDFSFEEDWGTSTHDTDFAYRSIQMGGQPGQETDQKFTAYGPWRNIYHKGNFKTESRQSVEDHYQGTQGYSISSVNDDQAPFPWSGPGWAQNRREGPPVTLGITDLSRSTGNGNQRSEEGLLHKKRLLYAYEGPFVPDQFHYRRDYTSTAGGYGDDQLYPLSSFDYYELDDGFEKYVDVVPTAVLFKDLSKSKVVKKSGSKKLWFWVIAAVMAVPLMVFGLYLFVVNSPAPVVKGRQDGLYQKQINQTNFVHKLKENMTHPSVSVFDQFLNKLEISQQLNNFIR